MNKIIASLILLVTSCVFAIGGPQIVRTDVSSIPDKNAMNNSEVQNSSERSLLYTFTWYGVPRVETGPQFTTIYCPGDTPTCVTVSGYDDGKVEIEIDYNIIVSKESNTHIDHANELINFIPEP